MSTILTLSQAVTDMDMGRNMAQEAWDRYFAHISIRPGWEGWNEEGDHMADVAMAISRAIDVATALGVRGRPVTML